MDTRWQGGAMPFPSKIISLSECSSSGSSADQFPYVGGAGFAQDVRDVSSTTYYLLSLSLLLYNIIYVLSIQKLSFHVFRSSSRCSAIVIEDLELK